MKIDYYKSVFPCQIIKICRVGLSIFRKYAESDSAYSGNTPSPTQHTPEIRRVRLSIFRKYAYHSVICENDDAGLFVLLCRASPRNGSKIKDLLCLPESQEELFGRGKNSLNSPIIQCTLNIFTTQPFYGGLIDKAADACCVLSCATIALIMNDEECLLISCETVPFWLNISTTQPFLWGMNI